MKDFEEIWDKFLCVLFSLLLSFTVLITGFIKKVTKGGKINTQKGKEPTVKIVYAAMD